MHPDNVMYDTESNASSEPRSQEQQQQQQQQQQQHGTDRVARAFVRLCARESQYDAHRPVVFGDLVRKTQDFLDAVAEANVPVDTLLCDCATATDMYVKCTHTHTHTHTRTFIRAFMLALGHHPTFCNPTNPTQFYTPTQP